MLTRRWFLGGLIAAPVVLQADRLMPIRGTPYDPWVRFQTWPIGEPQPMDEVLTTRGNTVTNSYGGVVRLSTFRRIRAEQAFPLHFEFTSPHANPWPGGLGARGPGRARRHRAVDGDGQLGAQHPQPAAACARPHPSLRGETDAPVYEGDRA